MKSKFSYLVILILLSFSLSETKIGYIYSIEIMNNYVVVRQMNIELEKEQKRLESLYKKKMTSYDSLKQAIETGSIILSRDKVVKMEADLKNKQRDIEQFQLEHLGPQGSLYKKQEELLKPILSVIDRAIKTVGEQRGYDYIFDAANGAIVYALDANDLTADVLEELKKIKVEDTSPSN
jgi:Skp family chaperone for outer membrane proteins